MHSLVVVAAIFAAGVLASPINQQKRDMEVHVEYVTVVDYVYDNGDRASTSATTYRDQRNYYYQDHPAKLAQSTSVAAAAPVSSTANAAAAVAPSSSAAPAVVPSKGPSSSTSVPPPPPPPATTTASPAPAAVPRQGGATSPKTLVPNLKVDSPIYEAIALDHHNIHRSNHSAPDVVYNKTLATWAQAKAESCVWNEDAPEGVNMNIAQGTYLDAGSLAVVISNMWYNSELSNFPAYGVANLDTSGKQFQGWGHFTQVVWPSTTNIGCGSAACGPGTSIGSGYFVACMYYPPGNYIGQFDKVGKPKGQPSCGVDDKNAIYGL